MGRIIVIEDNPVFADYVCRLLESKGFRTGSASTCSGARKLFADLTEGDVVLADLRLPDGDGIALLEELRKQGRQNPYIVMTDYDEVPTAVHSMKLGAEDYIPKKLLTDNLFPLLKALRKRTDRPDTPIHERQSAAFREIDRQIRLVAPTNMSVLVTGESGTVAPDVLEPDETRTVDDAPLDMDGMEKRHILRALEQAKGNRTLAAELLGIGRTTLYNKMRLYDINSKE